MKKSLCSSCCNLMEIKFEQHTGVKRHTEVVKKKIICLESHLVFGQQEMITVDKNGLPMVVECNKHKENK